jgi:hypothetical protein
LLINFPFNQAVAKVRGMPILACGIDDRIDLCR